MVAALTNTSGTGSEGGALWLFCACATAIADEIPARTEGVEAAMITMCVLLALLLLVDALTIREVTRRANPAPTPPHPTLYPNVNANEGGDRTPSGHTHPLTLTLTSPSPHPHPTPTPLEVKHAKWSP